MTDDPHNSGSSASHPTRWEGDVSEHDVRFLDAVLAASCAIASADAASIDTESALRRVYERLAAEKGRPAKVLTFDRAHRGLAWRVWAPALAAGALLAIGIPTLVSRRHDSSSPSTKAGRAVTTAVGQRNNIKLADGTLVVLGPGSRLLVAAGYGDQSRTLDLEGQAFFVVKHDATKPFTVNANGSTIRDIGTKFSVRSDAGSDLQVIVTDGIVALATQAGGKAVLRGGDEGRVKPDGEVTTHRGKVTNDDISWMIGKLAFREAPIAEVSASLRRWYGIDLRVEDPQLNARHITASFNGESPDRVLEVIGLALGADIERKGDTAIVRGMQGKGKSK